MSRPYSLPEMKVDSCDHFSQHARMHQYLGSRSRECVSRQASHAAKTIGRAIWSMTEGSYRFCLDCSDLIKDSSSATSLTTVSHTDLPSSSDGGKNLPHLPARRPGGRRTPRPPRHYHLHTPNQPLKHLPPPPSQPFHTPKPSPSPSA